MSALWIVLAAWPFARELPPDHVVARAQGPRGEVTVSADRLRRYAEDHPDRSPAALAAELIEFELLAAEAEAKGLDGGEEVRDAVSQALVRRYVVQVFEAYWDEARVPLDLLQRSYERNKAHFVHPALRRAAHAVLVDPADPTKFAEGTAKDATAEALARRIAAELHADPPADEAAFKARCRGYTDEAKAADLELRVEGLGRFAEKGRYVPAFTKIAFSITEPGRMSGAFRTGFGWHVLRVESVEAAKNETFEEAEAGLRGRILTEVRMLKLRELSDTLAERYNALINPDPLEQLEARRTGP